MPPLVAVNRIGCTLMAGIFIPIQDDLLIQFPQIVQRHDRQRRNRSSPILAGTGGDRDGKGLAEKEYPRAGREDTALCHQVQGHPPGGDIKLDPSG